VLPGKNWRFAGQKGTVIIRLPVMAFITALTIIHPQWNQLPEGFISSAPKKFCVYVSHKTRVRLNEKKLCIKSNYYCINYLLAVQGIDFATRWFSCLFGKLHVCYTQCTTSSDISNSGGLIIHTSGTRNKVLLLLTKLQIRNIWLSSVKREKSLRVSLYSCKDRM